MFSVFYSDQNVGFRGFQITALYVNVDFIQPQLLLEFRLYNQAKACLHFCGTLFSIILEKRAHTHIQLNCN